jgi:hypothetical protein
MASQKQIEANRRNGAKSGGPKTAVGKARSKMNAQRHGFAKPEWAELISNIEGHTIEEKITALWEKGLEVDRQRATLVREAISNSSEHCAKLLGRAAALERYSRRLDSARRKLLKREIPAVFDRTNPIQKLSKMVPIRGVPKIELKRTGTAGRSFRSTRQRPERRKHQSCDDIDQERGECPLQSREALNA